MRTLKFALLSLAAMSMYAADCSASVVLYTDQASWEAALGITSGGGTGLAFESDASQQFVGGINSLTDFDVTISGNTNSLNGIRTETNLLDPFKSGQYYEGFVTNVSGQDPMSIQWDFATPLSGWSGVFGQANNSGTDPGADPAGGLAVTINGQTFNLNGPLGDANTDSDSGFIGFVDDMATFSQITITQNSTMTIGPSAAEYFTLDNVAVVPEPSVLGIAVGALALLWRRRR